MKITYIESYICKEDDWGDMDYVHRDIASVSFCCKTGAMRSDGVSFVHAFQNESAREVLYFAGITNAEYCPFCGKKIELTKVELPN